MRQVRPQANVNSLRQQTLTASFGTAGVTLWIGQRAFPVCGNSHSAKQTNKDM